MAFAWDLTMQKPRQNRVAASAAAAPAAAPLAGAWRQALQETDANAVASRAGPSWTNEPTELPEEAAAHRIGQGDSNSARRHTRVAQQVRRPRSAMVGDRHVGGVQILRSEMTAGGSLLVVPELTADRLRSMIPQEMKAILNHFGLKPEGGGSTVAMRRQLIEMLPDRRRTDRLRPTSENPAAPLLEPGYRPSREHVARADRAHRRAADSSGSIIASQTDVRGSAPRGLLRVRQPVFEFRLTDIRSGGTTTLDFLRRGRAAVLLFWGSGIGGGVDTEATAAEMKRSRKVASLPHDP
eukprot:SAG31_NODE_3538_length_4145_cov_1.703658_2_plen_296_part_00